MTPRARPLPYSGPFGMTLPGRDGQWLHPRFRHGGRGVFIIMAGSITRSSKRFPHAHFRRMAAGLPGIALALAVLAALFPLGARAQAPTQGTENAPGGIPQRIVALVNDEPISAYDVVQRLRLTLASIGGVKDEEQFARLQQQVIRNMVDDKLKLQEAAKFDIKVTDKDAEEAFRRQAANFRLTPEQFEAYLARLGIEKQAYLDQMKPEIAWQQLVEGRLGPFAAVSREEAEAELERLKASVGEPQYHLSEIYLIVDNPAREAQVRDTARRLVEQLREGADFAAVARQFSQSASAAAGGDMGWVTAEQLPAALADAVARLDVGEISEPIRHGGGITILKLNDRRKMLEPDPLDAEIELAQIVLPVDANTSEQELVAIVDKVEALAPQMTDCAKIPEYAAALGAKDHGSLGRLTLRDLPADLRRLLVDLPVGHATKPVRSEDGMRLFFVCDRRQPEVHMPTLDEIIARLEDQKLAMMARRYLRDLRRNAIIDYR